MSLPPVAGKAGDGPDSAEAGRRTVDAPRHRDRPHIGDELAVEECAYRPFRPEELPQLLEPFRRWSVVEGSRLDENGLLQVVIGQRAVLNTHGRNDCRR